MKLVIALLLAVRCGRFVALCEGIRAMESQGKEEPPPPPPPGAAEGEVKEKPDDPPKPAATEGEGKEKPQTDDQPKPGATEGEVKQTPQAEDSSKPVPAGGEVKEKPQVEGSSSAGQSEGEQKLPSADSSQTADQPAPAAAVRQRRSLFNRSADSPSSSAKCPCGQCEKLGCRCCTGGQSSTTGYSETAKMVKKDFALKIKANGQDSDLASEDRTQASPEPWVDRRRCRFNATNVGLFAILVGAVIAAVFAAKRARLL